jgi:FkbM family methyltransferase
VTYQSDLIFDVGMHLGVDTRYYLDRGFRVVAVEANPELVERATGEFAKDIAAGKLIIENVGVYTEPGSLTFYVNESNSEWSSFRDVLGQRGGKFHAVVVDCVTMTSLVEKHGIPWYLKIDVEGVDHLVVRDVAKFQSPPLYLSIEDNGIYSMVAMYEAGVRKFKFSNQIQQQQKINPYTGAKFGDASSGVFGDDIEGPWMDAHTAFDFYVRKVRPPTGAPIDGWWDIHGVFR